MKLLKSFQRDTHDLSQVSPAEPVTQQGLGHRAQERSFRGPQRPRRQKPRPSSICWQELGGNGLGGQAAAQQ